MQYILSNGKEIESIPIGKSPMKKGENFNYLTILDRGPNTSGRKAMAICQCRCGNIVLIAYSNVKSGHTKSCGCYNKEIHQKLCKEIGSKSHYKDYTKINNPYYNFLYATNEKDNTNSLYWIIECKNCKKQYKEIPAYLISDTRRKGNNPCSCWKNISKGVLKIQHLLSDNNIKYEQEKKFESCVSPKGNMMKFDFYVNNEYLIEYDGEQHFEPMSFGDKQTTGQEKLKSQKIYDNIKNEWCKNNNIILIRIPYTQYNNLNLQDLIPSTSKFIVKEENNNE